MDSLRGSGVLPLRSWLQTSFISLYALSIAECGMQTRLPRDRVELLPQLVGDVLGRVAEGILLAAAASEAASGILKALAYAASATATTGQVLQLLLAFVQALHVLQVLDVAAETATTASPESASGVLDVVADTTAAAASEAADSVLDVASEAAATTLVAAEGLGTLLSEVLKVLLVRHLWSARENGGTHCCCCSCGVAG